MLRQGLNIKLGQSLTMTPQLQQAIKLLQLSAVELQQEIQTALDENPLLEIEDEFSEKANDKNKEKVDSSLLEKDIPTDLSIDARWDDIYEPNFSTQPPPESTIQNTSTKTDTLQDHLLWQVQLSNLSAVDKAMADIIISRINNDGYLTESLQAIYQCIQQSLTSSTDTQQVIEFDELEAMVNYIQHLDPIGVGARNLGECLSLQLQYYFDISPLVLKTTRLLKQRLDLLAKRDYKAIKKWLKLTQPELDKILGFIKNLNPKPGNLFESTKTDYIIPDIFVSQQQGKWQVRLNGNNVPNLQINHVYTNLLNNAKQKNDSAYLKSNLQQANWLIQSVKNRNVTILNVARAIVTRQSAFLKYGEEAMQPMVLKDIAEELAMHESTISRVTTSKYMHTPRGIYEFKYFFSSQVDTESGGKCSSIAIQAMIKKLVKKENRRKPLSDNKLRQLLKELGIKIARRTVSKYREAIGISASHARKVLA